MTEKYKNTSTGYFRFLREPFLHFILLGLLIFILAAWRDTVTDNQVQTIRIDDGLKAYLVNLYNVQFGTLPDNETTELLIDNYIRDEVLFREAIRLGLAQQDEIIRRRLAQKMEYLLLDSEVAPQPTDDELLDFMQEYAAEFSLPDQAGFEHIYFAEEGEQSARARAQILLELHHDSGQALQPDQGDRFPLNHLYTNMDYRGVAQLFGQSDFSTAVFSIETGEWAGPFRSGYGWHLLKINSREEGVLFPLEEIREVVVEAWQEQARDKAFEEALQEIIDAYTVIRVDTATTATNTGVEQ